MLTRMIFQVTKNLTERVCGKPIRSKGSGFDILNLTMGSITTLIVIARLLYKQFWSYQRKLSPDDWAVLFTVALGVPCTVLNTAGLSAYGLGKDVWTIPLPDLTTFAKYFFAVEIIYLAETASLKLSFSLFYLSIFPKKNIRRLLMITCVVNILYGVAFVTSGIFACTPVSRFWTQYVEEDSAGYCVDFNLIAWVHGAIGIALDLWMIALPLSQVKGLEMHWKKKLGVILMFLLGTFVTVVSIMRLQSLIHFSKTINPTWDNSTAVLWSTVELSVGLNCACLPTLRLMLVRVAPHIFSTIGSRSESQCPPATNNSSRSSRIRRNISRNKPFEISSIEMSAANEQKWVNSA
ncbi:hypothetical protein E4U42_002788 [Claviceps africana]|uniref:Rhodopsin domain-containing protein n=1 Tax=Claviceps africana TaxID=83212 RepID=A0A8K0NIC8_9HYPO|nr:hypothetical protein E4U42_002788 [Claviceps africana]